MSKIFLATWLLVFSLATSAGASCISERLISSHDLSASARELSFANLLQEINAIARSASTPYERIKVRLHALLRLQGDGVPFSAIKPIFDQTLFEERAANLQPSEQFDTLATLALIGAGHADANGGLSLLKEAEIVAWSYPSQRFAGPHPEEGAGLKGADLGQVLSYYLLSQDLNSATTLAADMRRAGFAKFVDEPALKRSAALERLKAGDIAAYEAIMDQLLPEEPLGYASFPDFTLLLSERINRKADISKIVPVLVQKAHKAILGADISIVGYAANTLLDYHRDDEALKLMRDAETTPEPKGNGNEPTRHARTITRLTGIARWYAAHGKPDEALKLLSKARREADTLDINGVAGQWALSEIAEAYVNIGDMFTAALVAKSLSDEEALRVRAAMAERHIQDGNVSEACGVTIEVTENAAASMARHQRLYLTIENASALDLLSSLAKAQAESGDKAAARESLAGALALARPAANLEDRAGAIAQIANAAHGLGLIGNPQPDKSPPDNPQPHIALR